MILASLKSTRLRTIDVAPAREGAQPALTQTLPASGDVRAEQIGRGRAAMLDALDAHLVQERQKADTAPGGSAAASRLAEGERGGRSPS